MQILSTADTSFKNYCLAACSCIVRIPANVQSFFFLSEHFHIPFFHLQKQVEYINSTGLI